MQGKIKEQPQLFTTIRLEELVPAEYLLRKIDRHIDLSFVDKITQDLYSSTGRPSIAPELLVRMMLIGYLYGLNSERGLCQEVQLNLAYRWFCRLELEDKVPDHSTFSKNRHGRFEGNEIIQELFYAVVEQAMKKVSERGQLLILDKKGRGLMR